jgi:N-acetylmuramoyl-L-alanine amidase
MRPESLSDGLAFRGVGQLSRPVRCLLLLALAAILSFSAMANGSNAAPFSARGYKMAGDALRTRIVMQFDREPDIRWFLLRDPHRLVVDLPETNFAIDPRELEPRGLITAVRYGNLGAGHSRMILSADGPFVVEKLSVIQNEQSAGFRLVADIVAGSQAEFEAALNDRAAATASAPSASPRGDRLGEPEAPRQKRFTIVIDPGHGGIDGGAEGVNGTVEKSITLAFGLELEEKLQEAGIYDVFMTRERDEFLRLDERVRIARQHEANIFISIHADTIRLGGIRGATVYTMSETASDAEAEATADRENLADAIAGISMEEENPQVADILMDLVRRETHSFTMRFARSLVGELSESIEMINNPHRSAGFRVLKAPDVPSVLVELGYLSNPQDEAQLRSPEWRAKAVDSIAAAIAEFSLAQIAAGG